MSQFGKSSSKRGKPTYSYSIIGVAVVLFLFGLVGWFFLNLRSTGNYFKENIQVNAYLWPTASKKQIDSLQTYVKSLPYARNVEYTDKEKAMKIWNSDNDTSWKKILDFNPLPESLDFNVTADYVEKEKLTALTAQLQSMYPEIIKEFKLPTEIVARVSGFVKIVAWIFLGFAVIMTVLVIFSIDNTIRLAMYSNRFLVKTMQMVGATRNFISLPLCKRAVLNGLIAAGASILVLWVSIMVLMKWQPLFKILHNNKNMFLLFALMIFMGVSITLLSTYRSVLKYLKMKLDDLY